METLLSLDAVSDLLGISPMRTQALIDCGEIPSRSYGPVKRCFQSEIQKRIAEEKAKDYSGKLGTMGWAALTPNTRKTYLRYAGHFITWCANRGLTVLPAKPATIAAFVEHASKKWGLATINLSLAAINSLHMHDGLDGPSSTSNAQIFAAIDETHEVCKAAGEFKSLDGSDFRKLLATLDQDIRGVRDRAIFTTGLRIGTLKRSYVAALTFEDVSYSKAGDLQLTIRERPGFQGRPRTVLLPQDPIPNECPVLAMRAWLERSGINTGPIFRQINKAGAILERGLSHDGILYVVHRAAKAAGLDPKLGAHSLRRGAIETALRKHGREIDVAAHTGLSATQIAKYAKLARPPKKRRLCLI